MPNTPRVDFRFENNNIQASVPLLGVSHVVARTTKGPANDPSLVINSFAQFQNVFGEEIVPDGTISNIQKAFELGSKLRISKVLNAGAGYGYAGTNPSVKDPAQATPITITLSHPSNTEDEENSIPNRVYKIILRTKNRGEEIVGEGNYDLTFTYRNSATKSILLTQTAADGTLLSKAIPVISYFLGDTVNKPMINVDDLQTFINTVPFIELIPTSDSEFKTIDQVVADMRKYTGYIVTVKVGEIELGEATTSTTLNMYQGDFGEGSDVNGWIAAFDALEDYNDGYQIILSHIHQHLPVKENESSSLSLYGISEEASQVYTQVASKVSAHFESVLYVEIPKEVTMGETPVDTLVEALKAMVPAIGYSKNICYYGGGIKYYNNAGVLQNCDLLGTVIGLGDAAASKYGPWFSFSGMNRGVVPNALGPVMPNLGGPSKIDSLQRIAEWFGNLFVIKNTNARGQQTMLWHGFTSNPINSSDKFLTITRLNLYIKKNLRPILESFIEEPNTWSTWSNIYYLGKEVMDSLVSNRAISSYEWLGDQDVQSYSELQINNEADVKMGKYHIVLKYKDIVTLQEITMDVVIDSSSQDVSISVNE